MNLIYKHYLCWKQFETIVIIISGYISANVPESSFFLKIADCLKSGKDVQTIFQNVQLAMSTHPRNTGYELKNEKGRKFSPKDFLIPEMKSTLRRKLYFKVW